MYSSDPADVRCRACLIGRRNMRSIFRNVGSHTPHTYADLIGFIANVKIQPNDGGSEIICFLCRTKAEEAYEFKSLVEESNKQFCIDNKDINILNDASDNGIDYGEMENPMDIDTEDVKDSKDFEDIKHSDDFENIEYEMIEGGTETENDIKTEPGEVTVKNSLNNIKEEPQDLNDGTEDKEGNESNDDRKNSDEEYFPKGAKKPRSAYKTKKKRQGWKKFKKPEDRKSTNEKENKIAKPKRKRIRPPRVPKIKIPQPKDFICPYCGKLVKAIEAHILTHTGEKEFKCNQCPKAYFSLAGLQSHVFVHSETKNFKCDICNAEFYKKGTLKSHMTSHKKIKDQVCSMCNKGFKRKSGLTKHILRHSSANKTIKCDQCKMSFFSKDQLQHHIRIHTGERPYKCELCSQPYSYKRDFDRHCLKKHGVYVQKRGIRIMNEELLQKERRDMRAALESQQQADAVQSILSATSSAHTDAITLFKYPHLVDASQLKTLLNL